MVWKYFSIKFHVIIHIEGNVTLVSMRALSAALVRPWELWEVQASDPLRMDYILEVRDACLSSVK